MAWLWLLLAHGVFITVGYAQASSLDPVDQLVNLAETVEGVLRAIVALALIMVVGAVSARYARRRLAYETWHFIHFYTYLAVVLAFTHQVAAGSTFTASPTATAYWYCLWGVASVHLPHNAPHITVLEASSRRRCAWCPSTHPPIRNSR